MKIGFTGTREGLSEYQRGELIDWLILLQPTEVYHGLCEGGDEEFHDLVRILFPDTCRIIGHPPLNKKYYSHRVCDEYRKEKDYISRNHDIVDESDALIGCPKGEEVLRSGTWATIRFCKKTGKECIIIER